MAEYIKREDAIAVFGDIHPLDYNASAYVNAIKNLPSADVAPVVHGRWRRTPMACYGGGVITEYECSVCEEHQVAESPYCPNCGARMDEEDV